CSASPAPTRVGCTPSTSACWAMPDAGRARQSRRARTRRLLLSALALLSLLLATAAGAAPRIAVLSMQPGEVFFERFGHNALVVADPATGAATSYNFGYFDPTKPGFIT